MRLQNIIAVMVTVMTMLTMGATTSRAALIDFTSNPTVAGISGNTLMGPFWTLTGAPTSLNLTADLPGPGPIGPLAGDNSGIGIGDDEVTFPSESLALAFDYTVTVTGLYFLDLFFGGAGTEFVLVSMDGVPIGAVAGQQFNPGSGNTNPGYASATGLSLTGKNFVFTVSRTNDLVTAGDNPDYALAGVEVAPVPVPAALPLLASGIGALGFIGWRRKRRVRASA